MNNNREGHFLFNHSPIPMWLFDIETLQFVLVNDAACKTYGYTQEEFLSLTIRDIRLPDVNLYEVSKCINVNVFEHVKEKRKERQERDRNAQEDHDRAVYERLKDKFEK